MITDFIFDGQELSGFGYIICDFDGASGTETHSVSEKSFTNIKSPLSSKSHVIATSDENDLNRTIQIMKSPCNNENLDVTNDDLSELSRWLCRKEYKLFKWVDDKDDDEIFYEVQIKLRKIELAGGRVGAELDITANAPHGFTRKIINKFSLNNANSKSITVFSDDEGYIYPNVIITIKEDGNLELVNHYENRTTYVADCKSGEILTFIGGNVLQIISSDESHDLSACCNYKSPRFCVEYRNYVNTFTSNLSCDVVMEHKGIRKVGL